MKCGTTWLDAVLRTHPDIYMPRRRKEVHFFDEHYGRGLAWYERFFPKAGDLVSCHKSGIVHPHIGEITPLYLYRCDTAARIYKHLPKCRFLIMLRHPVDRAYSHYTHIVRNRNAFRGGEDVIHAESQIFRQGLYAEQIARYFALFPREQFLFLIFEECLRQPETLTSALAKFFDISPDGFDLEAAAKAKDPTYQPRWRHVYAFAKRIGRLCERHDLDWVVRAAKAACVKRVLGGKQRFAEMNEETRRRLTEAYAPHVVALEALLERDLSVWEELHQGNKKTASQAQGRAKRAGSENDDNE